MENEEKTIAYTYSNDSKNGWNKLLVGVDLDANGELSAEESITYDAIGNPTAYLGAQLTWNARQLEGYTNAENSISYTYDADGLRASKTVNGAKTIYQYVDSALYYQCTYTPSGAIDTELYFFYDSYGNLASIRCFTQGNEYTYYTTTNIQGDVLGIYDPQGNIVASYEYDTWGNMLSTTDTSPINISQLNPIRYRGYYFDIETNLYYLQSRYYNPQVGRFLNADGYVSTGQNINGNNMFTYCGNNPVNKSDPSGQSWIAALIVTAIVASCAIGLSGCSKSSPSKKTAPSNYIKNKSINQSCYSYAFNLPKAANPGDYSLKGNNNDYMYKNKNVYSTKEITNYILRDMKALKKNVRTVSSPSDKTNNEYIVAMKTSDIILPDIGIADYHFAVQLSDGTWADKPGQTPSRWNALDGTAIAWDCGNIESYYNSESVYFAVEK